MREVAWLFLKLGTIAFGGPAAHIAMMREEVVRRRRWLSDEQFVDLLGATNLIPGPNSTEMAIHLGFLRAGWPGLIAGGICFIVPAMLIVLGCAWLYVRYGARPEAGWFLYGVKPVIIAIVVQAMWGLLRSAVKGYLLGGVPGAALATLGIFLPSFVFVALSHPLVPKIRASRRAGAFLDGVNVAALGLMAAVTWQLGRAAIVDLTTAALALVALALLLRFKLNSAWLVLGGSAVGAAIRLRG